MTNGPFELRRWQAASIMNFERSARYRGQFSGNVQHVTLILEVGSREALVQMYEEDRLDVMQLFPSLEGERARQRHAEEYFSGPMLHTQYIAFNVREAPFRDVRVRRAFALATDQEMLANVTQFGYQFPALGGFVPPGMPGH